GSLGTAAFGLVDASKVAWGSVNHFGFSGISKTVRAFLPADGAKKDGPTFGNDEVLDTLRANWFNGTDLAKQKAIAKTLINSKLTPDNAEKWAHLAGIQNGATLTRVAHKITSEKDTLTSNESDVHGRFDLALTAMLDQAYQHADGVYRNGTRAVAM